MEQEVPVIMKSGEQKNPEQKPQHDNTIPEQVKEIGETLAEAFARFRESDSYERILEGVETAREYIRKYPGKAMLYTLGAGAFFGLLMGKKR
jgi:hypothetical protein